MRATVYCPSCQQQVWKDDVHSCWDEKARANDQKVRDAERVVLSRAVEFVDAVSLHEDTNIYLLDAHIELRVAVDDLLTAKAAS